MSFIHLLLIVTTSINTLWGILNFKAWRSDRRYVGKLKRAGYHYDTHWLTNDCAKMLMSAVGVLIGLLDLWKGA